MAESAIPARGGITLTPLDPGGAPLQMTTDPVVTDDWSPDKSVEPGIAGASTTYDFGQFANRAHRTLTWGGAGQWLDQAVIATLRGWCAVQGSTYRYVDPEGQDWTVELLMMRADREFGLPRLYRCTLTLHVLAMATLYGSAYTGA